MSKSRNKRAVSPVIATVILVAIAITIAVAVAYWMGGIAGQFTNFEQVEIQSGYSSISTVANVGWYITLELKNTGTAPATLISVFINDVPVTQYDIGGGASGDLTDIATTGTSVITGGTSIVEGDTATLYVYIGENYGLLSSGTTVNVKVHSAGGMDYIKLISLT